VRLALSTGIKAMNKPLWNTRKRDPRNMIGDSVLIGHESLFRTWAILTARVGNDTVSHVTIDRRIIPVKS